MLKLIKKKIKNKKKRLKKWWNFKITSFKIKGKFRLNPYEEFVRLEKKDPKERFIGYHEILLNIFKCKNCTLQLKMREYKNVSFSDSKSAKIDRLTTLRNKFVHGFYDTNKRNMKKEADMYAGLVWKYLRISKYYVDQ